MTKGNRRTPRLLCYISSIPYGFDFPYRGNEGNQHQDRGQGFSAAAPNPRLKRSQTTLLVHA